MTTGLASPVRSGSVSRQSTQTHGSTSSRVPTSSSPRRSAAVDVSGWPPSKETWSDSLVLTGTLATSSGSDGERCSGPVSLSPTRGSSVARASRSSGYGPGSSSSPFRRSVPSTHRRFAGSPSRGDGAVVGRGLATTARLPVACSRKPASIDREFGWVKRAGITIYPTCRAQQGITERLGTVLGEHAADPRWRPPRPVLDRDSALASRDPAAHEARCAAGAVGSRSAGHRSAAATPRSAGVVRVPLGGAPSALPRRRRAAG